MEVLRDKRLENKYLKHNKKIEKSNASSTFMILSNIIPTLMEAWHYWTAFIRVYRLYTMSAVCGRSQTKMTRDLALQISGITCFFPYTEWPDSIIYTLKWAVPCFFDRVTVLLKWMVCYFIWLWGTQLQKLFCQNQKSTATEWTT